MKSNVSDHLEMAECIYIDACAKCTADVSDLRDLETIRSRVEKQGLSFLTITLPNFCRDFERSLAVGHIDSTFFQYFRKNGLVPAFLQGLTSQLFDMRTGRIYEKTNESEASVIVGSIRQICLAFKKIEVSCTPKRIAAAISSFTQIECDLKTFSVPQDAKQNFCRVSSVLWDNILADLRLDMLVPGHGPGAAAEHISGNRKYAWRFWADRLEPFFPLLDSAYSISAFESRELELVTILSESEEIPVRVIPVPKTLKSPRIIAIEPLCMQYAQQAIQGELYARIESAMLTKGHVNFRDQSVNKQLAIMSSDDGRLATIDLSDASDRVPRELALEMFRSNPDLRDAIDACRSTKAQLPDGTIIGPLLKFASMGSALCFPVEAMYFYTICVVALLEVQNLPVTYANCFIVSREVYVYGDDIIVPSTYAVTVLDYLRKYNCKVNDSKTFWTGKFRESCGTDAYAGESVTPTYVRRLRPQNRHHATELISWVSTANSFYLKGYWRTASHMFEVCERILGPLPYVREESSALGRISYLGYCSIERWNRKLHRFEVKAWSPRPVYRSDSIDGYSALQKSLLRLESSDKDDLRVSDPLNLERTALYRAVALQRGWVPAP